MVIFPDRSANHDITNAEIEIEIEPRGELEGPLLFEVTVVAVGFDLQPKNALGYIHSEFGLVDLDLGLFE